MIRFIALAYGITWLAVTPLVLSGLGLGPSVPGWIHGLGALGPVLAAYFSKRDHGLYERRRAPAMSRTWIAVCLATPALFAAASLAPLAVTGSPVAGPLVEAIRNPGWLLSLFAGSVMYGLGEEPGWRGWLLDRLERRHTAVGATLILAPIWAAWHAPFFFYRFQFEGFVTVVGFFIGLLAGAFWLTFLFNSTGGSVKIVAAWHVMWNVANISLGAVSSLAVGLLNALMMVLGFGVVLMFGRRGLTIGQSHEAP
jgi:CAAX protease family protein